MYRKIRIGAIGPWILLTFLNPCHAEGRPTESAPPDVSYVLTTMMENGRMNYFGVGGIIGGIQNPLLLMQQGDRVALTLINFEDTLADISIPALGIESPDAVGRGACVTLHFQVREVGELTYRSRYEELRRAGLEGKILVTPVLPGAAGDSCSPW